MCNRDRTENVLVNYLLILVQNKQFLVLTLVGVHVPVQAALLDEAFLTYRTFVSLLSSVSCHVTVERRTLSELVPTYITHVVALSSMCKYMNLKYTNNRYSVYYISCQFQYFKLWLDILGSRNLNLPAVLPWLGHSEYSGDMGTASLSVEER